MKKKILTYVWILIICLLSACGTRENGVPDDNSNEAKEDVELTIYAPMMSTDMVIDGWMGDIISDELGLKITVECMDVEKADVIFSPYGELSVSEFVDTGKVIQWTDEMLSTYGQNITKYRKEQLDAYKELCDGKIYGFMRSGQGNGTAVYMIASTSDKVTESMKLINWLCDPENMVTIYNGPKGVCWDVDDEGYYYLTEFGAKCLNDVNTKMPGDSSMTFSEGSWGISPYVYYYTDVNPASKHNESFNGKDWIKSQD